MTTSNTAKPFLKWAGGKRWLIERHSDAFPRFEGKYIEPFLGGGSVFFNLAPTSALISDSNARLIECYLQIRDNYEEVVSFLEKHQKHHAKNYYYEIRAKLFKNEAERSAQFLYLNRTCFNGLYRVNRNGVFNVPIGTKDKIIDESESFAEISAALSGADIVHSDFEEVIEKASEGDFIFVDPPYTVKHNLNGFLKYNEKIFSWDDQVRLRDAIVRAAERGALILLTNAAHASVVELYENVGKLRFVQRSSVLAGKSAARGSVSELIVTVG
jgi:DNA adenine methylase